MEQATQAPETGFPQNVAVDRDDSRNFTAIPCSVIRGGTSKGVFLLDEHLPAGRRERDRVLLALMGSPDPRQVNGLGGADPLTSKVAIVSRSQRENVDVEYESVEVGIAEARVNHGLMCGNLIAGVGHFALAEGLVAAQAPLTTVRIYCRSNRKMIVATVPVADGHASGLPAPGSNEPEVGLLFFHPAGAITGKLLPTGEPLDRFVLDNGRVVEVSIVDAGTLYAFIQAGSLGLSGHEGVDALDADSRLRHTVESLRQAVAARLSGLTGPSPKPLNPRLVKIAIVTSPGHRQGDVDIVATVINTARTHKAYAVSGGICLAAAAVIPGSLVNRIVAPQDSPCQLRIGHPSGALDLALSWAIEAGAVDIHLAEIRRSARVILRGTAYVPAGPAPCGEAAALASEAAALAAPA